MNNKPIKLVSRLTEPLRLTVGMMLKKYDKKGKVKIHIFNQLDYDDREVYHHYRSSWQPIELCCICDDQLQEGDKFLSGSVGNPELANKVFIFLGKRETDLVEIQTEGGVKITSTKHLLDKAKKVIATHEQIARVAEYASIAGAYAKREITEKDIEFILDADGKCYLEMEMNCPYPDYNDWKYWRVKYWDKQVIIHLSEKTV